MGLSRLNYRTDSVWSCRADSSQVIGGIILLPDDHEEEKRRKLKLIMLGFQEENVKELARESFPLIILKRVIGQSEWKRQGRGSLS